MALVNAPNACGPMRVGDATQIRVGDWRCNIVTSDFVHLNCPCSYFSITDIYGSTHDDFVALSTVAVATFTDCYGDITDGFVGRLFPKASGNAVDLYSYATQADGNEARMRRVTIDTVHGNSGPYQFAAVYSNVSDIDDIVIRGIKVTTGASGGITYPVVLINGSYCKKVTIEDISWLGGGGINTQQAAVVKLGIAGNTGGSTTGTGVITVRNVHVVSGTYLDVVQVGPGSTINKLLVENVDATCRPTQTFNVARAAGGTIAELVVNDVALITVSSPAAASIVTCAASISHFLRVSGIQYFGLAPVVSMVSGGSCPAIIVRDVLLHAFSSSANIVNLASGSTAGQVSLTGITVEAGTSVFSSAVAKTVRIGNSDLAACTGAPFTFISTGANQVVADSTVRWPNPATTAVTSTGGTLRVTGPTVPWTFRR